MDKKKVSGRKKNLEVVKEFLEKFGDSENLDLAAEMVQTTLNLLRDDASRGDIKVLNKALKELRYAFKVFSDYRHLRKVSVFGSARTPPGTPDYDQAVTFGRRMAERGYMVITGAGPGIMSAALEGAGKDHSFGVNIKLPFEQSANPVIDGDPKLVTFKYFFDRKLVFVKETSAIVCLPGGFGTLDEAFESLTLIQTGKSLVLPVVLLDSPGGSYWKVLDEYIRTTLIGQNMISEEDLHLYRILDDVDEAVEEIERFYRVYHSMRYVNGRAVIRINHLLERCALDRLSRDFADILDGGGLEQRDAALPRELGEPEIANLPRLVFSFNKKKMGRLRAMIDQINRAAPAAD